MNRLEKLKHCTIDKLEKYNHAAEVYHPASYYAGADKGWELASAEYEKIIADAINTVKSWFPVDIFPEDGHTVDSKCAKMARKTCENILAEIQKLKEFRV